MGSEGSSSRFNNRTGTNTPGTGVNPRGTTTFCHHSNPLQIRQPTATILIIGMADIIASHRPLSTDITYSCHDYSPYNFNHKKSQKDLFIISTPQKASLLSTYL
jgi:hypothetical protein